MEREVGSDWIKEGEGISKEHICIAQGHNNVMRLPTPFSGGGSKAREMGKGKKKAGGRQGLSVIMLKFLKKLNTFTHVNPFQSEKVDIIDVKIWKNNKTENRDMPKLTAAALCIGMMFSTLFASLIHIYSAFQKCFTQQYNKKKGIRI